MTLFEKIKTVCNEKETVYIRIPLLHDRSFGDTSLEFSFWHGLPSATNLYDIPQEYVKEIGTVEVTSETRTCEYHNVFYELNLDEKILKNIKELLETTYPPVEKTFAEIDEKIEKTIEKYGHRELLQKRFSEFKQRIANDCGNDKVKLFKTWKMVRSSMDLAAQKYIENG